MILIKVREYFYFTVDLGREEPLQQLIKIYLAVGSPSRPIDSTWLSLSVEFVSLREGEKWEKVEERMRTKTSCTIYNLAFTNYSQMHVLCCLANIHEPHGNLCRGETNNAHPLIFLAIFLSLYVSIDLHLIQLDISRLFWLLDQGVGS